MSDLSRLRARLVRIERHGKALRRALEAERTDLALMGEQLTRGAERRIQRLERELDEQRKDWRSAHALVQAEERRLLADPGAFLRFT